MDYLLESGGIRSFLLYLKFRRIIIPAQTKVNSIIWIFSKVFDSVSYLVTLFKVASNIDMSRLHILNINCQD